MNVAAEVLRQGSGSSAFLLVTTKFQTY